MFLLRVQPTLTFQVASGVAELLGFPPDKDTLKDTVSFEFHGFIWLLSRVSCRLFISG